MSSFTRFLTSRWGPIITGLIIGVLAPVLVKLGNPGNMGICVVCFNRDIAGALALHRASVVQYIRPEIIGFVLGALIAALSFREFRPRTGSAPLVRFLLGMFAVFGALVFLGCPWRAYLRLSGGDWNAIFGILGLIAGIGIGIGFLKIGFSLGRNRPAPKALGWVMPAIMVTLLVLVILALQFGRDAEGNPTGPIFFSTTGPGSQHALIIISLAVGLVIGFLAQRSRFCTVGAVRDRILVNDSHLLNGVIALIVGLFAFGIFMGLLAVQLGNKGIEHGATTFGKIVKVAGWLGDLKAAVSGREGDVNSAATTMSMLDHNFSCRRAREELGYSFRPLEDTVQDAWDWFVARGYAGEARQRTALAR